MSPRLTRRSTIAVRALCAAAGAAVVLTPAFAGTADVGNVREGLIYARAHCGECHAVESSDEISPDIHAPNFVSVANTPGMTERALVVWLQTSHPTMPNIILPPDQRDNVVAYIMSLKRSPSR